MTANRCLSSVKMLKNVKTVYIKSEDWISVIIKILI